MEPGGGMRYHEWERDVPIMEEVSNAACLIYLETGKPVSTLDIVLATDLHPGTVTSVAHQSGLSIKEGSNLKTILNGGYANRMYEVRQRTIERYIEEARIGDG
tara:strand:- start:717 stop:1025 length:309 start_codon:yes stop_codon:yes gene_type:complete